MAFFKNKRDRLKRYPRIRYPLCTIGLAVLLQACATQPELAATPNVSENGAELTSADPAKTAVPNDSATGIDTSDPLTRHSNRYEAENQRRMAALPPELVAQYQQALSLIKTQQWQQAEQQLAQLASTHPELSGIAVNRALIALHQDQLELAANHISTAISTNPNNPYAHQISGIVATKLGDFVRAEASYRQALTLWPAYPEANINLAILLELYRGRLADAHRYYAAYLETQPESQQAQRLLAAVELKLKRAGLEVPQQRLASKDESKEL